MSPYDIPNIWIEGFDVLVNKSKSAAYRAPGVPAAAFAMETAIDILCTQFDHEVPPETCGYFTAPTALPWKDQGATGCHKCSSGTIVSSQSYVNYNCVMQFFIVSSKRSRLVRLIPR